MSFRLTFLGNSAVTEKRIILDSNILLPQLGLPDPDGDFNDYLSFLSKLVKQIRKENNDSVEEEERTRIVLSPVQISEVFNKLIRYRANVNYHKTDAKNRGISFPEYYKTIYRKSNEFDKDYQLIKSDFEVFNDVSVIENVNPISFNDCLEFDSRKLDYNDNYLYLLAKQTGAIIVSHDKDFYGLENLSFATYDHKMYQKFKDEIFVRSKLAKAQK